MGMNSNENYDYWRVSDGKLRKTTTDDDPAGIKRVIKKEGKEDRVIYEIVNKSVTGVVEAVSVREGKFGKQLSITVTDMLDKFFIQVSWDSSYARSFLERLPGVNVSEEVTIQPYSFENDRGKIQSGITIYQDDKKVDCFFKTYEDKKVTGHLHGYPEPENTEMDSDDWKILIIQQMKFLMANVVESFPFMIGDTENKKSTHKTEPLGKTQDDQLPF